MAGKSNKSSGQIAEIEACAFLQHQGLKLIQKNFNASCGEIDLIMQDQDTVVFVEVRLREHSLLGSAIDTVNRYKQRKLIKTALLYLQKKRWLYKVNCRFDVLGMDGERKIHWIKNAFDAEW